MKSAFSTSWKRSVQPRKQRKYQANAPNHIRHKFMVANLDKPLRQKHKRRNIEVKKGDEVKIMRGKFKGKLGKVLVVDTKHTRIQVDGVQRTKAAGEKLETWFNPSNVKIISLDVSGSKRMTFKSDSTKQKENKELAQKAKQNKTKE